MQTSPARTFRLLRRAIFLVSMPFFILGLYVMCADLGATIGPLGGAWLYQTYGAPAPFYANGIILALCALVLAAFLKVPSVQVRAAAGS
jgi:predicted MFS family arabinose efflux permease